MNPIFCIAESSIAPILLYINYDESIKAIIKIFASWFYSSQVLPMPSVSITRAWNVYSFIVYLTNSGHIHKPL